MQNLKRVHVAAILVPLAIVFVLLWPGAYSAVASVAEDITLAFDPSAERAYEYGNRHFDARNSPLLYDIDRADELYKKALQMDPTLPFVRHQIGRIYFIRGELTTALLFLDAEISLNDGSAGPSSYYMRGLVEGYMGDYDAATKDYSIFLESNPGSWAGQNDYAWVLLKAKRYEDALAATNAGLESFAQNPWLLNSKATALYELGRYEEALAAATAAQGPASTLTEEWWHKAYPGNDPDIARTGIKTLQDAIASNIHRTNLKLDNKEIQ